MVKYLLLICLFFIVGCPATIPVITTLGTAGMATNKYLDYTLTKRGLDLKEREIELKEKQFEKTAELKERLDEVESFMKYFPKQFKDLGDTNKSEI